MSQACLSSSFGSLILMGIRTYTGMFTDSCGNSPRSFHAKCRNSKHFANVPSRLNFCMSSCLWLNQPFSRWRRKTTKSSGNESGRRNRVLKEESLPGKNNRSKYEVMKVYVVVKGHETFAKTWATNRVILYQLYETYFSVACNDAQKVFLWICAFNKGSLFKIH